MNRDECNGFRYDFSHKGHYESYFQRANHPNRPLAFWIRYTVFSPRNRPKDAVGELWAIYFNGESHKITAVKENIPITRCRFAPYGLNIQVGQATLDNQVLQGQSSALGNTIAWQLQYESPSPPLCLLKPQYYTAPFPKAKALVGSPFAVYHGNLTVNDETIAIDGWVGSQNHNWGSQHTDRYAWGQVCGFDNSADTHLEIATAKVKIGPSFFPIRTPWMTMAVLRYQGRDYAFNDMVTALRATAEYDFRVWRFSTQCHGVQLEGRMETTAVDFIGLPYDNPPGGRKTCLNSKIATAEIRLSFPGEPPVTLFSKHRAAFEILTDDNNHGVEVLSV
ncbi:MAG: hypothetical protein HUU55_02285 [Myxococcales bacterium]|nr:hypothetical protein [Myxococcales bacterium]